MWYRLLFIVGISLYIYGKALGAVVIGNGSDPYASYFVIEASAFDPEPFVFEVRYGDLDRPQNAYDLLSIVLDAGQGFSGSFINYGTEEEPNYFLDYLTYGGVTLSSEVLVDPVTEEVSYIYWAQYISGGSSWDYDEWEPVVVPFGTWAYGGGMSTPYRVVVPGSWDGLVYGDGSAPPSVEPIPEGASIFYLLLAAGGLWAMRMRSWRFV